MAFLWISSSCSRKPISLFSSWTQPYSNECSKGSALGVRGLLRSPRVVSASLISANGSQALSSSTVTDKKHHEELISLMLKTCADAW